MSLQEDVAPPSLISLPNSVTKYIHSHCKSPFPLVDVAFGVSHANQRKGWPCSAATVWVGRDVLTLCQIGDIFRPSRAQDWSEEAGGKGRGGLGWDHGTVRDRTRWNSAGQKLQCDRTRPDRSCEDTRSDGDCDGASAAISANAAGLPIATDML